MFNASSREQYVQIYPENEQLTLMKVLAEGDMGLDKGLGEEKIIETVEARINDALRLGDNAPWKISTGVTQLSDDISKSLSKQNKKLPSAPKHGGNSNKSAVDRLHFGAAD